MEKPMHEGLDKPTEYIDVMDEHNVPIGLSMPRDCVHAEGLWHRTVHIYIVKETSRGYELLVHKRSPKKKQYAGKMDTVFGGHLKAGQDEHSAAFAEFEEETGLRPHTESLRYLGFAQKDDPVHAPNDKEFNMIFVYVMSEDEARGARFDPEEIESVLWLSLDEVRRSITEQAGDWRPTLDEYGGGASLLQASIVN